MSAWLKGPCICMLYAWALYRADYIITMGSMYGQQRLMVTILGLFLLTYATVSGTAFMRDIVGLGDNKYMR